MKSCRLFVCAGTDKGLADRSSLIFFDIAPMLRVAGFSAFCFYMSGDKCALGCIRVCSAFTCV